MRLVIFSLVLGLAAPAIASAQESAIAYEVKMHQEALSAPSEKPRDPYTEAVLALKAKLVRQTKDDGGKLTPEHQAAIEKELAAINQRFGKTARR